jgi:hypothetical protein
MVLDRLDENSSIVDAYRRDGYQTPNEQGCVAFNPPSSYPRSHYIHTISSIVINRYFIITPMRAA